MTGRDWDSRIEEKTGIGSRLYGNWETEDEWKGIMWREKVVSLWWTL